MMKAKLSLGVLVLSLAVLVTETPASASVTIGTSDSGNCSLGDCLSGSFEYEQIYSALAFTGPIAFNQIGFFDLPSPAPNEGLQQPTPNAVFTQGAYTILFATTTAPLGSNFPVLPIANVGIFFTGTLGGPVNADDAYYITGSHYTYDPSMGNLVLIIFGSNVGGTCCSYFDNDTSGAVMSRAYYQAGEGTNADLTGLVTEFGTTPLPATLPLFASGLGALGLLGWRRKRKAAALAA